MTRKLDYIIVDLLESTARNIKAHPLNLGGIGGGGGGIGSPPGGYIGWLPQTRIAYDEDELATLSTLPSGLNPPSGWSLVDNLNHIRYRLNALEISSGILTVDEWDGSPVINNVQELTFSGATVTNLGVGHALVTITASSGGTALTVEEADGSPSITNVDKIIFSGAIVTDLGGGDVRVTIASGISGSGILGINIEEDGILEGTSITTLNFTGAGVDVIVSGIIATITISGTTSSGSLLHKYNEDLTPNINTTLFTTSEIYASGTLRVYYNGLRQRKSVHYSSDISFNTFSTYFTVASGESVVVDYDYVNTNSLLTDSYAHFLTESL